MHELLLSSSVPLQRHTQLLSILSGLSAMQPVPIHTLHLVFKPDAEPGSGVKKVVGGVQDVGSGARGVGQGQSGGSGGDLYYLTIVRDVDAVGVGDGGKGEGEVKVGEGEEREVKMGEGEGDGNGVEGEQDEKDEVAIPEATRTKESSFVGGWTMQFRDLPEVARQRQVTSRLITDTPITSGDPMKFMSAFDYSHTATYFIRGHRFTHLSTSLLLYRIYIPTIPIAAPTENASIDTTHTRLLDPSGAYILQASVKVLDGSKVETMTKGMNELLGLKETLRGCVELEMGDRLAFDTRVR